MRIDEFSRGMLNPCVSIVHLEVYLSELWMGVVLMPADQQ
ncbi:hypothetical protein VNG_0076H [Halobacterium salinarum NRC-1]|uniref:Spurious ORF n=2 Tax=Halobacterium salinarum TaxID=2242 RepID=Q9HSU0_HALSA|nr:hypothetical protein VNG_0076H [Halobacterium salinarum NRC-1]MBB6090933.1 hypothetical protein [Halobacterium salinarum]DAC77396.1 TPA_inf: spurious ORF [Halobacterium salinarum NRC-1]